MVFLFLYFFAGVAFGKVEEDYNTCLVDDEYAYNKCIGYNTYEECKAHDCVWSSHDDCGEQYFIIKPNPDEPHNTTNVYLSINCFPNLLDVHDSATKTKDGCYLSNVELDGERFEIRKMKMMYSQVDASAAGHHRRMLSAGSSGHAVSPPSGSGATWTPVGSTKGKDPHGNEQDCSKYLDNAQTLTQQQREDACNGDYGHNCIYEIHDDGSDKCREFEMEDCPEVLDAKECAAREFCQWKDERCSIDHEPALLFLYKSASCPDIKSYCDFEQDSAHQLSHKGRYILLFIFITLFLGNIVKYLLSLCALANFRIQLPYTSVLFMVGIALGFWDASRPRNMSEDDDGLRFKAINLSIRAVEVIDPHVLLGVFIPALIFESAFATDYHIVMKEASQSVLLAGPGVIINSIMTAGLMMLVNYGGNETTDSWEFKQALLFGAIVSATDPVAVVALLRDLGASKKLATLIEGESLLNDGSAFVLFQVMVAFVKNDQIIADSGGAVPFLIRQLFQLAILGVVVGTVFGALVSRWIAVVFMDASIEISTTIWACYLTFHLAENEFVSSGVLAVVFLGFYLSSQKHNVTPEVHESLHHVWEVISYFANTIIFVLSGVIIIKTLAGNCRVNFKPQEEIGWTLYIYVGIHLTRGCTMLLLYPLLKKVGYGLTLAELSVMIYGGLRGAIGLALAMITDLDPEIEHALADRGRFQDLVMWHVSMIVLLTLLVNATTIKYLVQYLELTKLKDSQKIILKEALRHLKHLLEKEETLLKQNEHYAGAKWAEVNAMRPDWSQTLGEITDSSHSIKPKEAGHGGVQSTDEATLVVTADSLELGTVSDAGSGTVPSTMGKQGTINVRMGDEVIEITREDLKAQVRHRFLSIMKAYYHEVYEEGMISQEAVYRLNEIAETALDEDSIELQFQLLKPIFDVPWWLEKWYSANFIREYAQFKMFKKLSYAVEVAAQFMIACEKTSETLQHFEEFTNSESRQEVAYCVEQLQKCEDQTREIWLQTRQGYPDVWRVIQTNHAAQRLLYVEMNELEHMFHHGLLDEAEYMKLKKEVLKKLHELKVSSKSWMFTTFDPAEASLELLFSLPFLPKNIDQKTKDNIEDECGVKIKQAHEISLRRGKPAKYILLVSQGIGEIMLGDEVMGVIHPGQTLTYNFMVNEPYPFEVRAKGPGALEMYRMPRETVFRPYIEGHEELEDQLWKMSAAFVLTFYFKKRFAGFTKSRIRDLCDQANIVRVTTDREVFRLPSMALLMTGEATYGDLTEDRCPCLLNNKANQDFKFSIGSIVCILPEEVAHEFLPTPEIDGSNATSVSHWSATQKKKSSRDAQNRKFIQSIEAKKKGLFEKGIERNNVRLEEIETLLGVATSVSDVIKLFEEQVKLEDEYRDDYPFLHSGRYRALTSKFMERFGKLDRRADDLRYSVSPIGFLKQATTSFKH